MFAMISLLALLGLNSAHAEGQDATAMVDRLALETALRRESVEAHHAEMVVSSRAQDYSVKYDPIKGYQYMASKPRLEGVLVQVNQEKSRSRLFRRRGQDICAHLDSPILSDKSGYSSLALYNRSSRPREDEQNAELYMAQNQDGEKVLTWLEPGEQVLVVEAMRESGGHERRIELLRRERSLIVQQGLGGTEACLTAR